MSYMAGYFPVNYWPEAYFYWPGQVSGFIWRETVRITAVIVRSVKWNAEI